MYRMQHRRSSALPEPITLFFDRTWRLPTHLSRTLKIAVTVCFWLLATAALIRYSTSIPADHSTWPTAGEQHIAQNWSSLLPRKMWQIFLTPPNANPSGFEIQPESLVDVASWLARNPGYEYVLVEDETAEAFVRQYSNGNSTSLETFKGLKNVGMKSDLLRYLILSMEGGIYSDIDTINLKPIDQWVPDEYQEHARVVIGVEFDRLDGVNWMEVHPGLQFCQWTIAAVPGHEIFSTISDGIFSALNELIAARQTTISQLGLSTSDIIELTGPSAWTDAVFRRMQQYEPGLTSLRNLSGLTEPRLVGDILILPINGFGMGQSHSNSTNDGSIPKDAMVEHKFRGSWRHEEK